MKFSVKALLAKLEKNYKRDKEGVKSNRAIKAAEKAGKAIRSSGKKAAKASGQLRKWGGKRMSGKKKQLWEMMGQK